MHARTASMLALLALLAAGCASSSKGMPQPKSANGAAVIRGNDKVASVPFADTGTTLEARLDQPIDTRLSQPGQRVSATLTQPIKGSDGSVLVPAGAKLEGKIAAIDHVHGPRIDLAFDTIALKGGPLPVGTRVVSAQQNRYRNVPVGGGVTSMQPSTGHRREGGKHGTTELSLKQGAVVSLVLTRPIIQGRNLK